MRPQVIPRAIPRAIIVTCFALLAVASASPSHATSINGIYMTPLGKVKIVERNGTVRATSVGKNKCGVRNRRLVFEGTRLDDSITGTIHACKVGPSCKGKVSGMMMILITRGGKTLSGAVHLDAGSCKTPLGGDGITISRLQEAGVTKKIKLKVGKKSTTRKARRRGRSRKKVKDAAEEAPKVATIKEAEAAARAGQMLLQVGKVEEARERFQEAAELMPDYANAYLGLGVTYYLRGRYGEALDHYKSALEAAPSNGDAYYNIACIYALQEKRELAFRYLSISVVNGYVGQTFVEDNDLVNLRDDPRWEQIKLGIPVATDPNGDKDGAKKEGTSDDAAEEHTTSDEDDDDAKDGAPKDDDDAAKDDAAKDGAAKDGAAKDGAAKDGAAKDGAAKDDAAKCDKKDKTSRSKRKRCRR